MVRNWAEGSQSFFWASFIAFTWLDLLFLLRSLSELVLFLGSGLAWYSFHSLVYYNIESFLSTFVSLFLLTFVCPSLWFLYAAWERIFCFRTGSNTITGLHIHMLFLRRRHATSVAHYVTYLAQLYYVYHQKEIMT